MHGTSLLDVITQITSLSDEQTLFAGRPWSTESAVWVGAWDAEPPNGYAYMLEVELVRDAIEVWSLWRDGRTPTPAEACQAVIHYAEHDAYLPV